MEIILKPIVDSLQSYKSYDFLSKENCNSRMGVKINNN